ncbi:glycosyltransferase [Paenibacillus sp. FJAT-26967]|uniref:MGDG synthase family glycosyltransferase n=1 Tax=Paenibacillus sp. FJAT-26967 TaxID=1729690 RepID=UPI000838E226|nr:glycosyltransferase [Paenibacillus sp. FJAT-26967]
MSKKRILLLSEGFGFGHTQAAHALASALRRTNPGLIIRVLELGAFLHPTIAPWIFSTYRKTIVSQPKMYGRLYRSQSGKPLNEVLQLGLHQIFYRKASAVIDQLKPDIIICTHPFPNLIVSRLKRQGLKIPLCTLLTDYDAHGSWINPEVDRYFVSAPDVKRKLVKKGVPSRRIKVTGLPVHPSISQHHIPEEIYLEFGLRDMPTVMLMGGGWGLLDDKLLNHIVKWRDKAQLLFCLGTNEKARQQLLSEEIFRHPNIHVFGYTREIGKLMEISDLLITKPGGMTCTEAMIKGVPMLFYNPIPGQEEENCLYFTEHGFGRELASLDELDGHFSELMEKQRDRSGRSHGNPRFVSRLFSQSVIELLR